jgi:hypothetical protein
MAAERNSTHSGAARPPRKLPSPRRPSIGEPIKAHFGDGKWHPFDSIVNGVGADEDHVQSTLQRMRWKAGCHNVKSVSRKVGNHVEWRVFSLEKMISATVLIEKLTPIHEGLRAEGKKNMATMSPATVAYLAGKLGQLLTEARKFWNDVEFDV